MITQNNISSISDLRFKTKDVLKKALQEPIYLFHRTDPKAVMMSVEKYNQMLSDLEDYYLSVRAEEFENQKKSAVKWITHKDVKKYLHKKNA